MQSPVVNVSFSFLITLVLLAGCTQQGIDQRAVMTANAELDARFIKAVKEKDLDAVMDCWWKSPDAVFYPADNLQGRKGWDAIRASTKLMLDGMGSITSAEVTESNYVILGNAVMGTGLLTLTFVPKGSPKPIVLTTRYTDLREIKNGKWMYTYGHESMNPMMGSEPLVGK